MAAASGGWSDELTTFHEDTAGSNHPIDRASRARAIQTLRRLQVAQPLILEVGCSSGFLLRLVQQELPRARLVGSDYVAGPLRKLAGEQPGFPLVQLDLQHCPIGAATVDAAVLVNVLEHVQDDRQALLEIRRLLRPGGLVHVEVPAGPALFDVYDRLLMHFRRYSLPQVRALLEATGFHVIDATYLGALVYPPFAAVKLWNRRYLSRPVAQQRAVVARSIRASGSNRLLDLAFQAELWAGQLVRWPFGIRCILTGRAVA